VAAVHGGGEAAATVHLDALERLRMGEVVEHGAVVADLDAVEVHRRKTAAGGTAHRDDVAAVRRHDGDARHHGEVCGEELAGVTLEVLARDERAVAGASLSLEPVVELTQPAEARPLA